ncbi:HpcH/HpaI aldolase/citrate lyase family protein [Chloroflexota bacterium]
MKETRIKTKIKEGQMAFMATVDMADPALVEIIGLAGYDAVFIDIEHSAFDFQLVEEMIRAADAVGIDAIVRVPENNQKTIGRVLDMGAEGIRVPHIKGREDALAAVQAVRYAPLGKRGMAGPSSRAMQYGAVSMAEHKKTSNDEIVLIVMIEDKEVIPEAEAIASIDGLDFVSVGAACLSLSLGVGPGDPKLKKAMEDIAAGVRRGGKAKLSLNLDQSVLPMNAAQLRELGCNFAKTGGALSPLLKGYKEQLQEYRAQLA